MLWQHSWPRAPSQVWFTRQVPHEPPQPFDPHSAPAQLGTQVAHTPVLRQIWAEVHCPQAPPQPLEPQLRPAQLGAQQ